MILLITKQVREPVWCIGSNNYIECTLIEFVGKLDWNLYTHFKTRPRRTEDKNSLIGTISNQFINVSLFSDVNCVFTNKFLNMEGVTALSLVQSYRSHMLRVD